MWEFWIDVGGTFTDCLGRAPDGTIVSCKVLSSGITQGQVHSVVAPDRFVDVNRIGDPSGFWIGYEVQFIAIHGKPQSSLKIVDFDASTGAIQTAEPLPAFLRSDSRYQLSSDEAAPLIAIRRLLNLRRDQSIPLVSVRLGTTRGTNALLTRTGARTAFVTTVGFGDILKIANQDRPRLFELSIKKPDPLFEAVIEIDERIGADGQVLRAVDREVVRQQLAESRASGIESLAVCLMHSFAFPYHERTVAEVARQVGFTEVSLSSDVAPAIKVVSRGDTTVVDAYINPILRRYLQSIQTSLNPHQDSSSHLPPAWQSQLRLMTSAGGLVPADQFTGKDSILSGPAGGVIGFSRVARMAGFEKAIGFDMGGTSTDVSRFDGRYELQYETRKSGVRIATPMLSIETVAAGGGSVCGFDGVKLTVGPASAGSDPGPACYGRGGPLTVTDANLFLGKILAERFPFPLDRATVEVQLRKLCDQIAASAGIEYSLHELAQGLIDVANANMIRPIRSISIAKGYDPRDYILVNFGSAAGQHACAIAQALGIRQILSHPLAGVLSAYGIGLAEVRRHAEQSVLTPYNQRTLIDLEPLFLELEQRCRSTIGAEDIPATSVVTISRSLDLRYRGVETAINVIWPPDGDFVRQYEQSHRQLYGYVHTGRLIEIAVARVELVVQQASPTDSSQSLSTRKPVPESTTTTWFQRKPSDTSVFSRAQLQPGDVIDGPAIICEPTSTLIIDPGFRGQVRDRGEIIITDLNDEASDRSLVQRDLNQADPILLEIFNNQFASIAEQMGITLQRTAISTNVKERFDFSCAIFSSTGDLVVNAPHIPVHLGAMSETVRRTLLDNPSLSPGDVYVTNDPYRGGSHLPDVTVVTPVHDQQTGRLLFLTASRAHHAEIGGIAPGSMPPFSKRLSEEGVLIRNFRLVGRGQSNETQLRELLLAGPYPTRAIEDNMADLAAQVAANQSGVQALLELIQRESVDVVLAYMKHIQSAAERKTRRALSKVPDGIYTRTDHLDDGSPLMATITIDGDQAQIDFAGTGPVLSGNLNANRAIVTAAVLYVIRCLIDEDIPLNSGVLAPISIQLPECLLNPPARDNPAECAAVVGGNVETSQRIVDVLLGALGLAAASQGTMNNLTFGDVSFGYYETICGGSGATSCSAGADAVHTHMTNTRLTDPEVLERRYPVRVCKFSIRIGSGGAGKHRGGDGVIRQIEFLKTLNVSILSERRGTYKPFGLHGGQSGASGQNSLRRKDSIHDEDLGAKVQTIVEHGDVLTIETPGGGGYGAEVD